MVQQLTAIVSTSTPSLGIKTVHQSAVPAGRDQPDD